ncbi:hypothetical protein BHE74_00001696 [Ensete ventricosum]|nr:hypothetical protein BHE74_00001696 [Ensete ventricosum]
MPPRGSGDRPDRDVGFELGTWGGLMNCVMEIPEEYSLSGGLDTFDSCTPPRECCPLGNTFILRADEAMKSLRGPLLDKGCVVCWVLPFPPSRDNTTKLDLLRD